MFSMDLCHSEGQVLIAVGNLEFILLPHALQSLAHRLSNPNDCLSCSQLFPDKGKASQQNKWKMCAMCPSSTYILFKKKLYLAVRLEGNSAFMYTKHAIFFFLFRKPELGCELVELPEVLHCILQYLGIDTAFYCIKEHLE